MTRRTRPDQANVQRKSFQAKKTICKGPEVGSSRQRVGVGLGLGLVHWGGLLGAPWRGPQAWGAQWLLSHCGRPGGEAGRPGGEEDAIVTFLQREREGLWLWVDPGGRQGCRCAALASSPALAAADFREACPI